ncbi:hypothetical protein AVEN_252638-1 [Araneus ventricosus]|uniref:Gustatory receptor n=1 Tax=Araneus ventricosus TaxID=182803 RepID=A0A4Y2W250_ARAVE|nr:hypothetical protein AVEN_252638-1 [Araneus ventricosus]
MVRRRRAVMEMLRILRFIRFPNNCKIKMNITLLCVLLLPFVQSTAMLIICVLNEKNYLLVYLFYQSQVESRVMMYSIAFFKLVLSHFLYPTVTNLVAFAYSVSCHLCYIYLRSLSSELDKCPPEAFTFKIKNEMLKKRQKIMKLVEKKEEALSTASFIACSATFMACLAHMSQLLAYFSGNLIVIIVQVSFNIGCAVVSTASIFFKAGQIPIEMDKFSRLKRRYIELRSFLALSSSSTSVEISMNVDQVITLSGCDLIMYRKSTILTFLGTILTYGLLFLGINFETDESRLMS